MGLRDRSKFHHEKCFFITTTCFKWKHLIGLANAHCTIQGSLSFVNKKYAAHVLGYVIMPNHLHLIIYFEKENRISDYMRDFKKFTSTKIRQAIDKEGYASVLQSIRNDSPRRAFQVWKDRFDDVYLSDKHLLETKLEYIHLNPLQEHWSLVEQPEQYEWSSAMFYNLGKQNRLKVTDYREFF